MYKKISVTIFTIIASVCLLFSEEIKLREYIDIALANNPELIALQNNYISAKFKFWEARSMYFPQVSANMSASRRVSPLSVTFGDTALFPGLPDKTDVTTYSQGLSAQQNIWDFGKTGSLVSKAGISRELSCISYEKKKQEVVYNVKKSYYNLMQAITIQNLASFNLKEIESLYNSVREREKEGLATPIDVLNIEAQYMNFKANVETAKHNLDIAMLSFTNILGEELDHPVLISQGNFPQPEENPLNFKNYEECKEKAVALRLDFQELVLQEKLAQKDVKGAYSEWLPSLSA
ncbi:MAG: TolC family protein, partial [Elusimicrobia bacterium]|nr:TolC family protein [Elusimicrobiota bacterium]